VTQQPVSSAPGTSQTPFNPQQNTVSIRKGCYSNLPDEEIRAQREDNERQTLDDCQQQLTELLLTALLDSGAIPKRLAPCPQGPATSYSRCHKEGQ
jgi:hypothetical protein